MANWKESLSGSSGVGEDGETPLLESPLNTTTAAAGVDAAVDYKGLPVNRFSSGRWRAASFIIGVEMAERVAYYGISSNLISYLTGPLGQSTAVAAENVNVWSGTASMLPLVGAFIADSFLGRYRTILIATLLYILGLGSLTVSAFTAYTDSSYCLDITGPSCSPMGIQKVLFFVSLYLVAIAQSGHKPCVQAFGADQFDENDPDECIAKSSFFNWWYFCLCGGTLMTVQFLNYIQDNLSWGLGFGIPCISMILALILFLSGTTTYRFMAKQNKENPFVRIGRVFVAAAKNWRVKLQDSAGPLYLKGSEEFRFLERALLVSDSSKEDARMCTVAEVEEAKTFVQLVPIWATCLVYGIVFSQFSTFFTKQGATMDRATGFGFDVPAASLQSFISLSIILFIPIYDRILVPFARSITGKPSGITTLQRIGTGISLSAVTMIIAALVEQKRLEVASKHGLIDNPHATVPMSIWWLIPQYSLFGVAEGFTMVGLQEFFYSQMPPELKSVGLSLYLSVFGLGSFLSSFMISIIDKLSSKYMDWSWFADNLNRAHLDFFYWLLAGMSLIALTAFMLSTKAFVYRKRNPV
ncbi:hypothetical protein QQ045_001156 [Rhodiola kirilowii]